MARTLETLGAPEAPRTPGTQDVREDARNAQSAQPAQPGPESVGFSLPVVWSAPWCRSGARCSAAAGFIIQRSFPQGAHKHGVPKTGLLKCAKGIRNTNRRFVESTADGIPVVLFVFVCTQIVSA